MTCSPETSVDGADTIETTLGKLIEHGYRFVHPKDADGELVAVVGVRVHGNVVDVVRLDAEDDVTATRMPCDEADILAPAKVLWQRAGELEAVIDDVLALADDDFADHAGGRSGQGARTGAAGVGAFVGSRGGAGCWVSNDAGRARWLQATA